MKLDEILTEVVNKTSMANAQICQDAWHRVLSGNGSQTDIGKLATNAKYAYDYAKHIGGRFPAGEAAILKSSWWSYQYAEKILKERWPEGEPIIFQDSTYGTLYVVDLGLTYPECKEHVNNVLQDSEFIQDEYTAYKELCQKYFATNSVLMNKWLRYGKSMKELG